MSIFQVEAGTWQNDNHEIIPILIYAKPFKTLDEALEEVNGLTAYPWALIRYNGYEIKVTRRVG